jgi:hypothetical protein
MKTKPKMKRAQWWVVSKNSKYLQVECEGFPTLKSAENWRDEHYAEALVLQVPGILISDRIKYFEAE